MCPTKIWKDKVLRAINDFKLFLDKKVYTTQEAVVFFEEVPVYIYDIVTIIDKYCSMVQLSKEQYFSIATYLMRFPSTYNLFKDVYFQKSLEKDLTIDVQSNLCTLISAALNDHNEIIFNCTADKTVGNFLHLMDTALDKICGIDIELGVEQAQSIIDVAFDLVEEILCLSMSIAQVSYGNDNTIITSGCRLVLSSMEDIKTEINKENCNLNMCNLVVDVCNDTLCAFEAKLNTAVLRLCLNVFSNYKTPLNELYEACVNFTSLSNQDTIDTLIIEFDLHMDRLFQIALFSVVSSTIGKSIAEIKSIIKNLEFLEGELVPSFMTMTKCKSVNKEAFANIFKNAWIKQIILLRRAVHSVIEPSAYCKLVHDELCQKIENLWQQQILKGHCIKSSMLDVFLNYTKELGIMIRSSLESFGDDTKDKIKKQLLLVHNVRNELEAARNLLIIDGDDKIVNKVTNERIFKRCQILVKTVKKLQLAVANSEEIIIQKEENLNCEDTLRPLVNVKNQTIQEINKNCDISIQRIINKSKKMVKDRSMCQGNFSLQKSVLDFTSSKKAPRKNYPRQSNYKQNATIIDQENMSIIEQIIPKMEMLTL